MSSFAISSHRRPNSFALPAPERMKTGEIVCVSGIIAAFLFAEMHNARLRPLWFDELATLFVASQPTMSGMFHAMLADGNPPLYFLLVRLCLHLSVHTEVAVRLPSMLAFPASALAVFVFVRRITSFRFGLLSMCILLGSLTGTHYAVEARAYALLLMFTALLLCFWQSARKDRNRRWALPGIALCTACAVLTHQYGILYAVLPITTGEIVRWIVRKRLDRAVLMCVGLGSLPIFATYPPMLRAQGLLLSVIRGSATFWARPGWADLGCYQEMWPIVIPILVPILLFAFVLVSAVLPPAKVLPTNSVSVPPEDLAVADVLTMFVPILILLTHFGTNFFVSRYAIGSSLGIALTVGILAAYASARWRLISRLVPLIVLYGIASGILILWLAAKPDPPIDHGASLFAAAPGSEPIVVASALEFVPSWWYADAVTRSRLHYLSDLQSAKAIPDMIPEYSLFLDRHQTPMQMEAYDSFVQSHRSFLIYSSGMPRLEWLQPRLWKEGWDLTLIASNKRGKLFRATAPSATR